MGHLGFFRSAMLILVLSSLGAVAAHAVDEFRVRLVREVDSKDLIQVGTGWRNDLPKRVCASLRVKENTPASAVTVTAYFYDKDNQPISSGLKPNSIWTQTKHGIDSVLLPPTLEKGKDVDVFFAITDELTAKKWKVVLIVFGNSTAVAARSFPSTVLPKLDFPEKSRLIDSQP